MSRSKLYTASLLLLSTLALGLVTSTALAADCTSYSYSEAAYDPDLQWAYCTAGSGSCAQCTAYWGGGYTVCTGDSRGYMVCIDYQW